MDSVCCSASSCDGCSRCNLSESLGTCSTLSCAPYLCNNNHACFSTCTTNAQCSTGNSCVNSQCVVAPNKANGQTCSFPGECASDFCVGGVCCDQSCTATCSSCTSVIYLSNPTYQSSCTNYSISLHKITQSRSAQNYSIYITCCAQITQSRSNYSISLLCTNYSIYLSISNIFIYQHIFFIVYFP